ncbi:DUF916 and DUF3324 domain-containing protein [Companilactobacillus ginsenosidimutans]|uniref:Uncharacterized protein n=1 Tax=Companilactobacillus ginsenosidimutans TaxID=1007676 RepID=A0A0H4QGX2_9LACO|nr:DUF916 and DUF3324 domain-containing protein [Companilactobacillus ginsenosidimutans]AKP66261.1 hypothetical protein ABM34_00990 [Companilactobacillus ginsenosidimutans]
MKRKWTLWIFGVLFIFLALFSSPKKVSAASTDSNKGAKYTVQAEIPDNQINKQVSFFDLKVRPGTSQDLKIKINNTDSKDHSYVVEVNRATTNNNGIVDYSQHGLKPDSSLQLDIESIFPAPEKVTVPANSTKEVTLKMNVPHSNFKGMVLGGIRVMQENQVKKPKIIPGQKLSVQNQFAYILGLQIQRNTDTVKPDLKLTKAHVSKYNGQVDVAAQLQNDTPTLINEGEVKASITDQNGSTKIIEADKKNLTIAPNSNFNLPVNTANQSLKPGKYTMRIAANGDNKTQKWNLAKNFTITPSESKKLKKVAAQAPVSRTQPNYRLIVTLAVIAALAIIALLIWNFKLQRSGRRH